MKTEASKLAPLVIAYFGKFGQHVPEPVLRQLDARQLIQESLGTGVPLPETGWGPVYSPRGCCIVLKLDEQDPDGSSRKRPGGEWLH